MFLKMEKHFQLAAQFSIPKLNHNGISEGDFLWLRSPFNNEEENLVYKWVLQNLMTFIASKREAVSFLRCTNSNSENITLRGSFILVIFKSMRQNDLWGIRHTIYFFSFTLEALWIFSKLVLFLAHLPKFNPAIPKLQELGEDSQGS